MKQVYQLTQNEGGLWWCVDTGSPMLCNDEARDWFDFPKKPKRLYLTLTDRYVPNCYQFVHHKRNHGAPPDVLVEGKRDYVLLFSTTTALMLDMLKRRGRCYLSLEYEE